MSESISRKDFLKGIFGFFRAETEGGYKSEKAQKEFYILPPGAGERDSFLQTCRQSYQCVSVCPYEAIEVCRENGENGCYGYPVIKPRRQACYFCEDFPCIAACESGALSMERKDLPLGIAVIDPNICFAYRGVFCPACVVKCPLSGKAISLIDNKPVVNGEACTGCGICVQVCPTEQPAIRIKPASIK